MVDPEVVATSLCQIKSLMPVYCGFESIGIRDRCSPGRLRLERATSLVVPPHGHKLATPTGLAPATYSV